MSPGTMYKVLAKLNKLSHVQIAVIMAVIGFAVFFTGLANPFQGDDQFQIVDNAAVHNIANLPSFFTHSTFYNGESLVGVFYRPLMTTTFSLIYTLFGANPLAYHLVQIALCIAGAFLVYLVLKHFLKKVHFALPLALIFLVHPLNSQVAFSIPTMQDALFFFFGMLALWLLIRQKALWAVAVCLLLAMFSKESGVLFALVAGLYLWWFDRERLKPYLLALILLFTVYLLFMTNAVGLLKSQHIAPIDEASNIVRLLTAPSIMLFYLAQLVSPFHLATGYYWLQTSFTVWGVLVPLVIDAIVVVLAVWFGRKLDKPYRRAYWFFAAWAALGLLPYLQFVRLDMTACDSWFRLAMVGVLGMVGIRFAAVQKRFKPEWFVIAALAIAVLFGVQTAMRGTDYSSQFNLAMHDVAASPQNHSALNNIAQYYIGQKDYIQAATYAQRSVDLYPLVTNYQNLGVALQQTGDYTGAIGAYKQALQRGDVVAVRENLALIYAVRGDTNTAHEFLNESLKRYPRDFRLWLYAAIFEGSRGSANEAKTAITNATRYGQVPAVIYNAIMGDTSLALPLLGTTVTLR